MEMPIDIPPGAENHFQEGSNPPKDFNEEFPLPDKFFGNGEFHPDEFDNFPNTEFQQEFNQRFEDDTRKRFEVSTPPDYFIPSNIEDGYIKPFDANFIPPTADGSYPSSAGEFYPPPATDGSYPPPSSGEFYPPPPGDGVYIPPSDKTILLPTVLFPLLPLLDILF